MSILRRIIELEAVEQVSETRLWQFTDAVFGKLQIDSFWVFPMRCTELDVFHIGDGEVIARILC